MSVHEVIPAEYVSGKGAGLRTEPLRKRALKGQTETAEPTKVTEMEQPGKGEGNKKSHVLEAKGRECFKRQVIA